MRWFFVILVCVPLLGWADGRAVVVPKAIRFADVHLKLSKGARKRIQVRVDGLIRFKGLFARLLDRTNLFFPLIEKTLAEENIPSDFKFQALHESGLVGDAVSHTQDIGFWQIQNLTALGLRLRIGGPVDERMHLIESTKAAARFLKSHYQYFDSWLCALLAYNRGRAGAIKVMPKTYRGTKVVYLDDRTDNYIIAVLATKLAFVRKAGRQQHATWQLSVYEKGHHGQNLKDIATQLQIDEKILSAHNRWLRTSVIPMDTRCSLIVPLPHTHPMRNRRAILKLKAVAKQPEVATPSKSIAPVTVQFQQGYKIDYEKYLNRNQDFPLIKPYGKRGFRMVKANGILAIVAQVGDTIAQLAQLGNLSVSKFLLINEIDASHKVIPGQVYYYHTKSNKGSTHYHILAAGEQMWRIAQRYGIKLSALLEKNRMKSHDSPKVGCILWLRFIRPRNVAISYK